LFQSSDDVVSTSRVRSGDARDERTVSLHDADRSRPRRRLRQLSRPVSILRYTHTHTHTHAHARTCTLTQHILYFKMPSVCPSVSATVSAIINSLPSDRLRCCDRYIRCQRSLAVKPLTMSGSPSHRGSVRRVNRSHVTHVPISNCSYSMCPMTVSKLMSTCGNNSCASGGDGRCASNGGFLNGRARRLGAFLNGRRVHYRSRLVLLHFA